MIVQLSKEEIITAIKDAAPTNVTAVTYEFPGYFHIVFNNGHYIAFGEALDGSDEYSWHLANDGAEIDSNSFPFQNTAKEVAEQLWNQFKGSN